MATIGLDKLFYAPITEAANGDEPKRPCMPTTALPKL